MCLASVDELALEVIEKDKDQSMLVRIVARSILDKKGGFDIIERLLDRAVGKPTQKTETKFDGSMNVNPILSPERKKMLGYLIQSRDL